MNGQIQFAVDFWLSWHVINKKCKERNQSLTAKSLIESYKDLKTLFLDVLCFLGTY